MRTATICYNIALHSFCKRKLVAVVGFETTPSKFLVPETIALDRWAPYIHAGQTWTWHHKEPI